MMKIDLCIWTYNSDRYLDRVLSAIDRAVPPGMICHKIAVDGGSKDDTRAILEDHGWGVHGSPPGIPRQANMALSLVDTPVFASFEHDVIIPQDWIRILDTFSNIKMMDVVAVTGRRIYSGSPTLKAIDSYAERNRKRWNLSMDNTIFRTNIIRRLGGFPTACPFGADTLLERRIRKAGLRWICDRSITTIHLRSGFISALKHNLVRTIRQKVDVHRSSEEKISMALMAPIVGAMIAAEERVPSAFPGYWLMRWCKAVILLISRTRASWRDIMEEGDLIDRMTKQDYPVEIIALVLEERRTG